MDHAKDEARIGVVAPQVATPMAVARLSTTALCAFPLALFRERWNGTSAVFSFGPAR
jgi:hypothetical protein